MHEFFNGRTGHPKLEELRKFKYAHRGFHDKPQIPENSLGAFIRAIRNRFGAELDVHLTKDGKLVVFHDDTTDRCTGQPGTIEERTLEEVRALRLEGTNEKIPLFNEVLTLFEDSGYPLIAGYRNGEMELLSQRDITRVYVEARKVRICAGKEVYESNKSLSFLEQQLNPDRFIRISRFEIANLRKISSFDFSTAGTVYIRFDDGSVTWAARRYVRALQQALSRIEAGGK